MLWIMRIFYLALILITVVAGAYFASENGDMVSVTILGFSLPRLSLGLWLMLFFLLGGIVGVLISLIPFARVKYQVRSLNKKRSGHEKEIAKLKATPLRN